MTMGFIRRAHRRFGLPHLCTVTPFIDGAVNGYNVPTRAPGDSVLDVPCRYSEEETLSSAGVTIYTPTLYLTPESTIKAGDRVSTIVDLENRAVQSGTFIVETVRSDSKLGASMQLIAKLRQGDVR